MMNAEIITVVCAGIAYGGFVHVDVDAGLNQAARRFRLGATEQRGEWNFPPGTPVTILANGDLVVSGYVNRYRAKGAKRAHDISIEGRGKGQDIVDCAAVHPTGFWENKRPDEIGQDLDKFGVGINARVPLDPIPYWQLNQGETVFRTLERALRPEGVAMMGLPDGSIEITDARAATRAAGALIEGVNIIEWTVDLADDQRHSEYRVKGQSRLGHGDEALRIEEIERDEAVERYRPRVLVNEADTDKRRARKRAGAERDRCAGESIRATVTVQSWRDDAGQLWTPNALIYVHAPILMHLEQDMLIEKVRFHQDGKSRGSTTKLSLVDPRTWKGGQGKRAKADRAWR